MPPQKMSAAGAWEDDWETIADVSMPLQNKCARPNTLQKEDAKPQDSQPPAKLTKAQLKAQHAELNRKIWESACVYLLKLPPQS